jgi:serine protease
MGRLRVQVASFTLAVACGVLTLYGQSGDRHVIIENLGLPAIDQGLLVHNLTHAPGTAEALHRANIREALREDGGKSGARYAAGRLIVKFRESASPEQRQAALRAITSSASIDPQPSYADFDMVRMDPAVDAEAAAAALAQHAAVEYAQPAYRVRAMAVPNDPLYATRQWNLPLINLERAWDLQPRDAPQIIVAVLDTGIAYMNATLVETIPAWRDEFGRLYPALGRVTIPYNGATQLMAPGRFVAPHDFIWDNDLPLDFEGHGTHVAGTIGQLTNDATGPAGVAEGRAAAGQYRVKLMPVKVIDTVWDELFGAPNTATDAIVARGIRYAADNGAKVINMSIGRTGPPDRAPAIEDAINYAVGRGVFIAIAAGNDFEDGNPLEVIAEIASRVEGAVSVAAVDRAKMRAFYSNTGSWVELAAPGGSNRGFSGPDGFIFQQTFDFDFVETYDLSPALYRAPRFDVLANIGYIGTSMATPHVSGLAAMMMQQGITDPKAVEAALERFAIDLGTPGRDNSFGYGLLDARASLRGLGLAK